MSRPTVRGSKVSSFDTPSTKPKLLQPARPEIGDESKQTVMIPRKYMRLVKEYCLQHNLKHQQVILAGLEMFMVSQGFPSISEVEGKDKSDSST